MSTGHHQQNLVVTELMKAAEASSIYLMHPAKYLVTHHAHINNTLRSRVHQNVTLSTI
ncbi:MAG: hypothetical protein IPH31_24075 [Lewinellaceae bacterium]|nr:hypothetical protein [Lewinellaceae bacterium]